MLTETLPMPAALAVTFIFILSAFVLLPKLGQHGGKSPPGPKAFPIIGNLHKLGKLPHRALQALAKQYGPIMSLRLGQVPTIVVSSPEAAELFLKTHDTVFSSRPKTYASNYISYGNKGLVFTKYGAYWRNVRKLCSLQLLHSSKVEMFAPSRREELGSLVNTLKKASASREVVDLTKHVTELMENITYKMILGRSKDDRFDLKGLVHEALKLNASFNLADFVPWLGMFYLQGLVRRLKITRNGFDEMLEHIIKDHEDPSNTQQKDFVDILLSLKDQPMDAQDDQGYVIDRTNIKAIILDMISAALDTSTAAIEWGISELLRHPKAMKRLQNELENVVGMDREVEEADLAKLPYLHMVAKETLRLYPVGPLLVPHEALEDVTVDGYFIKKNSRVIINVYAIGRDPKAWSDNADMFYPERFEDNSIEIKGRDFQLLPFGSGRRGCPGLLLGLTMMKIALAQLVHCFNWELPTGMSPFELDMSEKFDLTMPRSQHLLAMPTYRLLGEA